MIPADVASRMQLRADTGMQPVSPVQAITDKLADLVPGQRLMAEIQALLPNGTYRALINQRDVTLALPFSAKAGDTLELEVVDSDGKLTLAVISKPPGEAGKLPLESVPTTLSRTGQLIGNLFGKTGEAKSGLTATTLNGNQPIAARPPGTAQDLLPLLKQAISQSGVFYESHQAEWVEGRLDKSALLQEPQGRLPAQFASPRPPQTASAQNPQPAPTQPATHGPALPPGERSLAPDTAPAPSTVAESSTKAGVATATTPPAQLVAPQALPLVQQQLEAFATQNFVWQGQVWPGQTMHWEIEEEAARREQESGEAGNPWQTRLRLTLPHLGEVDAQIRLQGRQINLALQAGSVETQALLRGSMDALRSQLGEAGLTLTSLGVGETGGQTEK